jgi:hypothetical protein
MRIFDELESVGAHRIVGTDRGRRRIMRKWTHLAVPFLSWSSGSFPHFRCKVHANWPAHCYRYARFVHYSGIRA